MKRLLVILPSLLIVLLLAQCSKSDSSTQEIGFYTADTGTRFLYLNGVNKGELPRFDDAQVQDCASINSEGKKPLSLQLSDGDYTAEIKDVMGRVAATGSVGIHSGITSASSTTSGMRSHRGTPCVAIGLWKY